MCVCANKTPNNYLVCNTKETENQVDMQTNLNTSNIKIEAAVDGYLSTQIHGSSLIGFWIAVTRYLVLENVQLTSKTFNAQNV